MVAIVDEVTEPINEDVSVPLMVDTVLDDFDCVDEGTELVSDVGLEDMVLVQVDMVVVVEGIWLSEVLEVFVDEVIEVDGEDVSDVLILVVVLDDVAAHE